MAAPLSNRKLLTENFVIREQAYGSEAFHLSRQLQSKSNSLQQAAQVDQGYMLCFRIVIVHSCYKSF